MALHITMRQLQIFEAAARHMNFTRAAEELHLTQAAVSMQMCKLVDLLDLPLFERPGNKLQLTVAGVELLRHSKTMLAQLKQLEGDINALHQGEIAVSQREE